MREGESSPNLSGAGTEVPLCSTGVKLSLTVTAQAVFKPKERKRGSFRILFKLNGRACTNSYDFSALEELVDALEEL